MKKAHYNNFKYIKEHGAAMMIFAVFVFFLSMTIIVGISRPAIREFSITKNTFDSKQAYFLAESGVEDAFYRINNSLQIDSSESLVLSNTTTTTTITTLGNGDKQISALGESQEYARKVNMVLTKGIAAVFEYAAQAGTGGATIIGSSGIIGDFNSSGPILGASNGYINGTVIAANSAPTAVDQSFGSGTPTSNNVFGNAYPTEDVAQSFKLNTTANVESVQFYIKKVNSGNSMSVRIVSDQAGSPSTNTLATAQDYNYPMTNILPSSVTTNYQWVKMYFSTAVQLTAGTTYWLVFDNANSQASNYYVMGGGTGYANGTAKIGSAMTQSWSQLGTDTDLFFSLATTTGTFGSIRAFRTGSSYVSNVHAHQVTAVKSNGYMKCKIGQLSSLNNKECDTSADDPIASPFPITDQDITDSKNVAAAGGTSSAISLSSSATQTIGPKKITGNVTLSTSSILNVTGTLWITGNLTMSTSSILKLDPVFGANGGMIIVDGTVSISTSSSLQGSGTAGSYINVISTNTANPAVTVDGSSGSMILMAPNGGVTLSNSATANQVTAKYITLNNSATITYQPALAATTFVTGPSASWSLKSWKEAE